MDGPANVDASLAEIMTPFVGLTGGLISALRAIHAEYGFLPPESEAVASGLFNLSQAEIKGVISFYSDFRRRPAGRTIVRLCAAEACQAVGARALERDLALRFALGPGETSASGDLTFRRVFCLGLCSAGPAAMVDGRLMARASSEKITAAIDNAALEQK